jgi:hypothetical protein
MNDDAAALIRAELAAARLAEPLAGEPILLVVDEPDRCPGDQRDDHDDEPEQEEDRPDDPEDLARGRQAATAQGAAGCVHGVFGLLAEVPGEGAEQAPAEEQSDDPQNKREHRVGGVRKGLSLRLWGGHTPTLPRYSGGMAAKPRADYRFARSPVARGPSVSSLHLLRMGSDTRGGDQLQADRDHDTLEALRPRGP